MKIKALLILLLIISACSKPDKYDLSQIKSLNDLSAVIDSMKNDNVEMDMTSVVKEITGKGMHYRGVPVKSMMVYDNAIRIYTDSAAYSGKKLLEQLETENGFGNYKEGYNNQPEFTWENDVKYSLLTVNFVDGKNLAKMGEKDFSTLYITFPKKYNVPLANIYKEVKKYEEEPNYLLRISHYGCDYEIKIDGIVIEKFYEKEYNKDSFSLNHFLLTKGSHKLQINIKPAHQKTRFKEAASFEAKIIDNSIDSIVSQKNIRRGHLYEKKSRKHSFDMTFNANIPYNNNGWFTGENLRKEPKLKEKVIHLYEKLGKAFLDKDEALISSLYYDMTLETKQSYYHNDFKSSSETCEELLKFKDKMYKYTVSKDFEIKYSDDGKLIYTTPAENDKQGMLTITGKGFSESFNYFMYQPKNTNELKIIRK